MKRTALIMSAFLAAVTTPLTTLAAETACKPPSTSQVEKLFNNWNEALQTRDPKKIVALYADDAVLLPTLSNTPRTNHKELENYFIDFVKKHPSGKIDSRVIRSGCDWATDTGLYTFTLYSDYPKGEQQVTARFSYTYEDINGKWLIISHHSSLLPNAKDPAEDKREMSELEPVKQ